MSYIVTTIENLAYSLNIASTLVRGKTYGIYAHRKTLTITPESITHTDPEPKHTDITVTVPLETIDASDDASFDVQAYSIESSLDTFCKRHKMGASDTQVMIQGGDGYIEIVAINSDKHGRVVSGRRPRTPTTIGNATMYPIFETTAGVLGRIWHSTRQTFKFTYGNDEKYPDGTRYHVGVVDEKLLFAATSGSVTSVATFPGRFNSTTIPAQGLTIPSQLFEVAANIDSSNGVNVYVGVDPKTGNATRFILHADNGTVVTARLNDNPVPLNAESLYRKATGVDFTPPAGDVTQFTVPTDVLVSALNDIVGRARQNKGVTIHGDSGSETIHVEVFAVNIPHDPLAAGSVRVSSLDATGTSSTFDCPSLLNVVTQISTSSVRVTLRGPGNTATFAEVGGDSVHGVMASAL